MLYGLKNSAAAWSDPINAWMTEHGYENIDGNGVTFVNTRRQQSLHVDDGIVCTNDDGMYEQLIAELMATYELGSFGEMEYYLGCKVIQDRKAGIVTLTQGQYCQDALRRLNMHGPGLFMNRTQLFTL